MALRAFSALSPEKEAQDPNGSTYGPGVMEYLGCKMWCACFDTDAELAVRGIARLLCKTRSYRLRSYADVFVGSEAVQWLMHPKGGGLASATEAVEVGNVLLEMGYFDHVCSDHGLENKFLFYRWTVNPLESVPIPRGGHDAWVTDGDEVMETADLGDVLANAAGLGPWEQHFQRSITPTIKLPSVVTAETDARIARLEAELRECQLENRRTRMGAPVLVAVAVLAGSSELVWWVMLALLLAAGAAVVAMARKVPPPQAPASTPVPDADGGSGEVGESVGGDATATLAAHPDRRRSLSITDDINRARASTAANGGSALIAEAAAASAQPEPEIQHRLPVLKDLTAADGARVMRPNVVEPIKTDGFEGQAVMLIRTDPLAPIVADYFHGKRRLIELQIQGKFTRVPEGKLFMGGELRGTRRMSLSAVWRGIAWAVLGTIRALSPGEVHHSFGSDTERPHMAASFMNMVEKLVVTPPGQQPPTLGGDIPEDPAKRKIRRKASKHDPLNCDDTYTFTFHTAYADLVDWRCVNLPGLGSLDLHRFWGNASVAFIMYDGGDSDGGASHAFENRKDYLCIQIIENPPQ